MAPVAVSDDFELHGYIFAANKNVLALNKFKVVVCLAQFHLQL